MANYETTACFGVVVLRSEFELLEEVDSVCQNVHDEIADIVLSDEFIAKFGISPDYNFADDYEDLEPFLSMFPDADYPGLDLVLTVDPLEDDLDRISLLVSSSEFDADLVARIFQKCCPSALPFEFGYANTCSAMRPGGFSGSMVEVYSDRIVYRSSAVDRQDPRPYIIAKFDEQEGLLFWHNENGWGDLQSATTFTKAKRENTALPTVGAPRAHWLTLPECA